ncbi:hypothetical protein, partial [Roseobacter denitrificans]|uniref:hypothetical protein n=1 Tax=Roseobacter denitrificans TaxID=2434 RepID=UPI001C0E1E2A
ASLYFDFFIRISSSIFEKILLPQTPKFRGDYPWIAGLATISSSSILGRVPPVAAMPLSCSSSARGSRRRASARKARNGWDLSFIDDGLEPFPTDWQPAIEVKTVVFHEEPDVIENATYIFRRRMDGQQPGSPDRSPSSE